MMFEILVEGSCIGELEADSEEMALELAYSAFHIPPDMLVEAKVKK